MVKVLNSSKEVLAVAEGYLTLTFMISTDALPNISKHELFMLLGDWTDEAKFKEKLRHLSTAYFDFRLKMLGILRHLNNLQLIAGLLEILVESIMDHFVR